MSEANGVPGGGPAVSEKPHHPLTLLAARARGGGSLLQRILLRGTARLGLVLAAGLAAADATYAAPLQRIVSLNLCTDELLLRLVPHERISSVTWLARDPAASNVSAEAQTVPVNHGSAEEVIPAAPDIVLVGEYTTMAATSLLKRIGFRVASFAIPTTFDGVRQEIRAFGELLGVEAAANKLNAEIDAGLAAAGAPVGRRRPRALVFNPNGVTVGPGTLADALMTRAGLDNIAAGLPLGGYDQIPLEKLASLGVEVLILSGTTQGAPSLATDVLRHPVLRKLGARVVTVELPGRLWGCPGPGLVEAVQRLRAAGEAVHLRNGVAR